MVKTVIWEYQYTPDVIDTFFLDGEDWSGIEWLYEAAKEKIKLMKGPAKE